MNGKSCEQIHGYPMCMGQAARGMCTCTDVEKRTGPLVTSNMVAEALQDIWNDWCSDTGCIPSCFSIKGPPSTSVNADFGGSCFAERVALLLDKRIKRAGRGR